MARNPSTSGRNNSINLPKISGGQPIVPSHFNKLAEGIDRITIRTVANGGLVKQTTNGTIIQPPKMPETPSWGVTVSDTQVCVKLGRIYSSNGYACPLKQYLPNLTTSDKYIWRGGEITFSMEAYDANATSKTKITSSTQADTIVFDRLDSTKDYILWITHTGVLRYTEVKDFSPVVGFPIASIYTDNLVIVTCETDLFLNGQQRPFQSTVFKDKEDWKLNVSFGTVNNLIPNYTNGQTIGDYRNNLTFTPSFPFTYVWLKMTRPQPPAPFPSAVTIEASGDSWQAKIDTITEGWLLLASVWFQYDTSGNLYVAGINNNVSGSLRGEANQFDSSHCEYTLYAI